MHQQSKPHRIGNLMGCSPSAQRLQYIHDQTHAIHSFLEQAASDNIEHTDAAFKAITAHIDPSILSALDAQENPVPYLRTMFESWSKETKNKNIKALMNECIQLATTLQKRVQSNYEEALKVTEKANTMMEHLEKNIETMTKKAQG